MQTAEHRDPQQAWRDADEWSNPVTGFSIRVEESATSTGGERLTLLAMYPAYIPAPPPHSHPRQTEQFTILAGKVRLRLDGRVRDLMAGETVTLSPGQVHQMWNPQAEAATLRWMTTPALNTERWMGLLFALAQTGRTNQHGVPALPQLALLLRAHRDEFRLTKPPAWLQAAIMPPAAFLGALLGMSGTAVRPRSSRQGVSAK